MKTLAPSDLPNLPREALTLVADGVYSMYEISSGEPRYVLIASRRTEAYLLSSRGDFLAPVGSIAEIQIGTPIVVIGVHGGVRVSAD